LVATTRRTQFGCYDQTDPKSCQQNRSATTDEGTFITHDWGDGTHIRCFRPPGIDDYMACGDGKNIGGEIYNGSSWVLAPTSDPGCDHWSKGGVLTAEFLACEAALPPKQD
jgi:hypothetical protein